MKVIVVDKEGRIVKLNDRTGFMCVFNFGDLKKAMRICDELNGREPASPIGPFAVQAWD